MKKFILLGGATLAAASPAAAQQFRVEPIVGYETAVANTVVDQDFFYGIGVGIDTPKIANVTLGLDAEITDTLADPNAELASGNEYEVDLGRDIYVGGRFELGVTPNVDLFGKVGYSNLKADVTLTGSPDQNWTLDGIRFSAGGTQRLGEQLSLSFEYRYSNYERQFSRHGSTVGLSYRF